MIALRKCRAPLLLALILSACTHNYARRSPASLVESKPVVTSIYLQANEPEPSSRPVQVFPIEPAVKAKPAAKNAAASDRLKAVTAPPRIDPAFAEVSKADLDKAQAAARREFSRHWHIIAKRSRHARQRILAALNTLRAPQFLQIIPVVESAYNPYALSSSGALGLWQLMPQTGLSLGLHAEKKADGRRSIERSTKAAIRYIQKLYSQFDHNWALTLAAYNYGPNALSRRLSVTPWDYSDGLDNLPAPYVTRAYVKQIIGLASLLHTGELSFPEPVATRTLVLHPPVDISRLAKAANLDEMEIFRYTPSLNQAQYLHESVTIHVPASSFALLQKKISQAGPEYVQVKISKGDSLWGIARKYHTSVAHLKRLNPDMGELLRIGRKLKVPTGHLAVAVATPNPLLSKGLRIRYKIRPGDSLWQIASRFGTTVKAIARSNQIKMGALIHPGDTLWILARTIPS
jgi:membrane-bound lytic murein transglycosylase D